MIEEKKFTQEELQEISTLQNRYQTAIFQLGELQIRKKSTEEELKNINSVEQKLQEEYLKIQQDENLLLKNLSDKYGEGSLNIKTGTFTPAT